MTRTSTPLSSSWAWRMARSNGNPTAETTPTIQDWTPVSAFPSVIQMELLAHDIIPDFKIGENERQCQWVGHVDWEYQTFFDTPDLDDECVDLVFEGLDTFATVNLNGYEILKSSNMFLPARVDVKDKLRPAGEQNHISIVFESAIEAGAALEEKYGVRYSRMRDSKRNHTRKAQYHWGWDWGPIILTAGPYMPVLLETYSTRIQHVHVLPSLTQDNSSAEVSIAVTATGSNHNTIAEVAVVDADGVEAHRSDVVLSDCGEVTVRFHVPSPKLWWPHTMGSQHLYTASVSLIDARTKEALDSHKTRFGIRNIEIIERPLTDKPGTTFMFRVNGRDIFSQGANWIPADNLLPTITRERYYDWIKMVVFGNMNMIRVWGGGIYETEDFFDACDELGVLVWLDYGLACGDYDLNQEFLDSLEKEAEVQTIRLRNRASLAVLCGGNEDFLMYDWLRGGKYDHYDFEGPYDGQNFPQRKIFYQTLLKVAERLAPNIKYWANSPWGGADWVNNTTIGDIHQWGVWHLDQAPYQDYKKLTGRFVSEFGMHGFPVNRTVQHFLRGTPKTEHQPQSRTIDCHNKGRGAHTRIARYLAENFRYDTTSLENFTYATQLLQSEAYTCAMRDWKRQFNGAGDEACAGALIWQLNDVYPGTSWAFVDYFIRPKPSFYAVRRECAPWSVGIQRTPETLLVDENDVRESYTPSFEFFAHNTTAQDFACKLQLTAYDMTTQTWTDLAGADASRDVVLRAGYNTELGTLESHQSWTNTSHVILQASLVDSSGRCVARSVNWPEPFRYLIWPADTHLSMQVGDTSDAQQTSGEGWEQKITLLATQPLKGVWLEPVYDGTEKDEEPEPLWEDNMLDLMPGQQVVIGVCGLRGRQVSTRFLGDWELEKMMT